MKSKYGFGIASELYGNTPIKQTFWLEKKSDNFHGGWTIKPSFPYETRQAAEREAQYMRSVGSAMVFEVIDENFFLMDQELTGEERMQARCLSNSISERSLK